MESLFDDVIRCLPIGVDPCPIVSRFPSRGILNRFLNLLAAVTCQGDINHVTGDIQYLALLLKGRRTILTIHDCGILLNRPKLSAEILRQLWYSAPVRKCQVITAVSEQTKAEIIRYTGCEPGKIRVIPNCVGSEFSYSPKPFGGESPTILQIGTRSNKNVLRLITALRGIDCKLTLVGDLTSELRHALQEAGIAWSSESNLTRHEIVERYQECDLVSFVSTYEGFGMPIIEANAIGRPVITSDLSPMKEVAGTGACLVDPYDTEAIHQGVRRLIHDDEYRNSLIAEGVRNAAKYSASNIAEQYAAVYASVARELHSDLQNLS